MKQHPKARGLAGYVRELRFDPGKSWRFDFALADAMLAIEAKRRVEIGESKRKSRFKGIQNLLGGLVVANLAHPTGGQSIFPVLSYFSLTTLATIGSYDVIPLTNQARYAALVEGITGQFYRTILVARLVGLQMSRSAGQHTENS